MSAATASRAVLRSAFAWAVCTILLVALQLRPAVWLGYVVAGVPTPLGALTIADREIALPLAQSDGAGPIEVRIHVWHPTPSPPTPHARYPLIVYAPVWGETRLDNTALLASLSSHGFVVVAIDDIHLDPAALDKTPADTDVRHTLFDFTSDQSRTRMLAAFDRRMALQALKISHTLDALIAVSFQLPAAAAFNPRQIGIIGASFGGASAVEAGLSDARIRAVVNLDGWLRGKASAKTLDIPFANFNSTRGTLDQVASEASDANPNQKFIAARNQETTGIIERQLAARGDALDITITGASHSDFNNELYDAQRWRQWRPWQRTMIAPARLHEILDAHIFAFFAAALARTETAAPQTALALTPYPEVTIRLGRSRSPG